VSARAPTAAALLLAAALARGQGRPPAETAGQPRSTAVYPEQDISLRFSHRQHLALRNAHCMQCHWLVPGSDHSYDRNIPEEARCAACHRIEAASRGEKVDPPSACRDCHPGFDFTVHKAPRPSTFPAPNLLFSHVRHLARGSGCADCHGSMEAVELATRAQLPRMATCLQCHDGAKASADCATCHPRALKARGGLVETHFASGELRPGPGNPLGLDHGPRYERFHSQVAARQREQCMACHSEASCGKCHEGAIRPQSIHPGDYISTHMVPARQGVERCDACHRRQSFCVACHERTGVGSNADAPFYDPTKARVHPSTWLVPGPGHHGVQAARNIASCASCHREEQCLGCHASAVGTTSGTHVNPHPPGFAGRCRDLARKNDRACAKCHDLSQPSDAAARCR